MESSILTTLHPPPLPPMTTKNTCVTFTLTLTLTLGLALPSHADLVLTNGGFDRVAGKWQAQHKQAPDNWIASIQGKDSSYGEVIFGYGTGFVVGIKDVPGAYVQQLIGIVGEQTEVQVDFCAGYRSHSTYTDDKTARKIILKVSLWDATDHVELASITKSYTYTNTPKALVSESETLSYTIGAAGTHDLALRFENISHAGLDKRHATALVDTVSVKALPKLSGEVLLGLGGISLILHPRK